MKRPVAKARRAREIDRARKLCDERQRGVEPRRRVVTDRDVERLARDVLLGEIRRPSFDAGGDRRDDRRVPEARVDEPLKLIGQRPRLFGRQIEAERLDRGEPVARRLVGTKDGTKNTDANLMQDAERSECGRR